MGTLAIVNAKAPEPPAIAETYRPILFPWDGYYPAARDSARLIPAEHCAQLKAWIDCGMKSAAQKEALTMTAMLLGGFSEQRLPNPDAFTWHLETAFLDHPAWAGAETVRDYPRKYRFVDIANVVAMLEEKVKPLRAAQWVVEDHRRERERRAHEREAERQRAEAYAREEALFVERRQHLPAYLVDHGGKATDMALLDTIKSWAVRDLYDLMVADAGAEAVEAFYRYLGGTRVSWRDTRANDAAAAWRGRKTQQDGWAGVLDLLEHTMPDDRYQVLCAAGDGDRRMLVHVHRTQGAEALATSAGRVIDAWLAVQAERAPDA